jgi:hypothetical protein
MPRGRLAECAWVREQLRNAGFPARGVVAVDEIPERIERDVLCKCHPERESFAVHGQPLPDRVEGKTEDRSVRRVECETGRTPAASTGYGLSEHSHVGVVAAEEPLVNRLEEAPDRRGDGACSGRVQG